MNTRVFNLSVALLTACDQEDASVDSVRDSGVQLDAARPVDARVFDAAPRDAGRDAFVDARAPILDDAVSHYGLDWIRAQSDAGYVVRANVLIDAPLERVWGLVRDVNSYKDWSKTLTAEAASIEPDASIALHIQLLDFPFPPTDSTETIRVVDDARHAISWGGDFGDGEKSTRFQLVEPAEQRVRYTTGLLFTPSLGDATLTLLGANLQRAFEQFSAELKTESEACVADAGC